VRGRQKVLAGGKVGTAVVHGDALAIYGHGEAQ
jgi:hypothetical protein